jgi:hypothetical protein
LQLFYEDGRPRKLAGGREGCHRGTNCWFIHPDEPLWSRLPAVHPPPRDKLADDLTPPSQTPSSPSEFKAARSAHPHPGYRGGSHSPRHIRDAEKPRHSRRSLSPPWVRSSSRSEDRKKWDGSSEVHYRHGARGGRRSRSHDSRSQDLDRREKYKGAVSSVASRTCSTSDSPAFTEYTASGPPTSSIPPSPRLGDVFLDTRNRVIWYFADDWIEWQNMSRSYVHPLRRDRFLDPRGDQFVWTLIEMYREARRAAEDLFGRDVSAPAIIDRYTGMLPSLFLCCAI